ncbi:MAG TPA: VWA domain-containing protein [Cytophagaceae bacterium]
MKAQTTFNKTLFITVFMILILFSGLTATKVLSSGLSVNNVSKTETKARKIKIALLLDTSNSMDGLIDQAKSQLWTIVNELAGAKCEGGKPEIQIALYEYGNDHLPASEGYIRLVTPLTNDLDKISADLFSLKTYGGSEFCGHAIQTATNQLDWSTDGMDLQVIFIAGNEPFTQGSVNYRTAVAAAREKNIIVNTIFCGNYEAGISTNWKDGADLGGGSYMSIEQNRKTVFIPSPYDDRILELNKQLNNTYLEYGSLGKQKKEAQITQDMNAEKYGKANSVNRTVSKSTHVYKSSSWDLVDAIEEKEVDITKIPKEDLPQQMQSMTNEQKQKYVMEKKAERDKIKNEITELSKKREEYIAEQKKNSSDENMLDNAMLNSIKKQAASKNFTF